MKRFLLAVALVAAAVAWAGDESKCALRVGKNTAVSTTNCMTGLLADAGAYSGDGGCWVGNGQKAGSTACRGVTAVVQCDVDVYYDPNATNGGVATAADYKIEFTNNKDPAYIYLRSNQSDISFLAVSADGGCNVGISNRQAPTR